MGAFGIPVAALQQAQQLRQAQQAGTLGPNDAQRQAMQGLGIPMGASASPNFQSSGQSYANTSVDQRQDSGNQLYGGRGSGDPYALQQSMAGRVQSMYQPYYQPQAPARPTEGPFAQSPEQAAWAKNYAANWENSPEYAKSVQASGPQQQSQSRQLPQRQMQMGGGGGLQSNVVQAPAAYQQAGQGWAQQPQYRQSGGMYAQGGPPQMQGQQQMATYQGERADMAKRAAQTGSNYMNQGQQQQQGWQGYRPNYQGQAQGPQQQSQLQANSQRPYQSNLTQAPTTYNQMAAPATPVNSRQNAGPSGIWSNTR